MAKHVRFVTISLLSGALARYAECGQCGVRAMSMAFGVARWTAPKKVGETSGRFADCGVLMTRPEDVLAFWLDEVGPKGWYQGTAELDGTIRKRFLKAWEAAQEGSFGHWLTYPSGTLAYLIVLDQFPRNMFRGSGESFATDLMALAAAKSAINQDWDLRIDPPARQFFYLPLMHSENLSDQDRCVRLIMARLPNGGHNLLHARAHREVIRQFGRFPYRNDALGRRSTVAESRFLGEGGYGDVVRALESVPG